MLNNQLTIIYFFLFHSLSQPPNFKDCPNPLPSDILQKHSINSLLEHNDLILHRNGPASPSEGELDDGRRNRENNRFN